MFLNDVFKDFDSGIKLLREGLSDEVETIYRHVNWLSTSAEYQSTVICRKGWLTWEKGCYDKRRRGCTVTIIRIILVPLVAKQKQKQNKTRF